MSEIKTCWSCGRASTPSTRVRKGPDFRDRDLRGADFQDANLDRADFRGVDAAGAHFSWASLYRADFRGAGLRGADLHGADFRAADLRGADLRGADCSGVTFVDADLREADIRKANLLDADFTGTNLEGVRGLPLTPSRALALRERVYKQIRNHPETYTTEHWYDGDRRSIEGWAVTLAGQVGRDLETAAGTVTAAHLLLAGRLRPRFEPDATIRSILSMLRRK